MDNDSEILPRKKTIIYEKLKKLNSLDSTSSDLHPKKLKLRNDFTSFLINEKTNLKNKLDFPLCLSLFTNNQTINAQKIKDNQNNKLKLNLKSLKPKQLSNINFKAIIKQNNNKKIISRNSNKNHFNSLSPINSKFVSSPFSTPMKKNNSMINKLSYSPPPNIMEHKSPIVINQIGISNPIIKLNTKFNSFSNNSNIEQDISLLKNIKGLSLNSVNNNSNSTINLSEKKKMPSLFSSPRKSSNADISQKENVDNIDNKKIINQIKKKVHKDINNYEFRKNNNLFPKKSKKHDRQVIFIDFSNDKGDEKNEIDISDNNTDIKKNTSNNININDIKQLKLFDNIKNNKNSTFYEARNNNKFNKEYFNVNLTNRCSVKHFSYNKENIIKENNQNNKNESNINNNINDNESKIERLTRLKSAFRTQRGTVPENKIQNYINISENKEKESDCDKKEKTTKIVKRKETDYLLINTLKNKSNYLQEERKGVGQGRRRAFSTKNLDTNQIGLLKLKNNKFYLSICKQKTNDIYKHNKFLKKWNERITGTSSNNRTNRKIYIKKTKILVNIQEKVKFFIYKEKSILKMNKEIFETKKKTNIYLDEILSGKIIKNNDESLIDEKKLNNNFKCNLSMPMYHYIISSVEFGDITEILISIKYKNHPLFKVKTKSSRRASRMNNIPLLNLENNHEKFSISKTRDTFRKDIDWMYSPINLLSIQGVILRSIQYYYDRQKFLMNRRNTTIRRSLSNYYEKRNEPTIKRQPSFSKKFSANVSSFKKNLNKWSIFHNFSLLNQKKFFKRPKRVKKLKLNSPKKKIKDKEENSALSEYTSEGSLNSGMENSDSNSLEDIFYNLLTYILESKNKSFIKLFEEKIKIIDINQKLIEGNTLLILTAREGNHAIAKFLCEQGADVNIQNNSGNTALHYAIGNQFYSIADILTRFGAREDIANSKGLLPWDCNDNN